MTPFTVEQVNEIKAGIISNYAVVVACVFLILYALIKKSTFANSQLTSTNNKSAYWIRILIQLSVGIFFALHAIKLTKIIY